MEDIDIVNGIREQNTESLDNFITMYSRLIYGVIKSILCESYEAEYIEECYDDIILIIWFKIESFTLEKGRFRNWIISIAKFKALDYKRKIMKTSEEQDIDKYMFKDRTNIEEEFLVNEKREFIREAINRLEGIDKQIFLLRYTQEKSIEEIAERLGVTSSAIYTRISRGKRKLKKNMEEYYE